MENTNEKKKKKSLFAKLSFKEKKLNKIQKKSLKILGCDSRTDLSNLLKINQNIIPVEYYDLPYRYNKTVIKILAQTPHSLFIYWDISDDDRNIMKEKYGDNLFYETKPILLVHNKTLNYSFEVEIDDFANSWYLRTPTSDCVFNIELGRKKIQDYNDLHINEPDNLIHISASNTIESPNDHILTESLNSKIYFKNIKTNEIEEKNVPTGFAKNIYNIFETCNDSFTSNPSSDFRI